MDTSQLPVRGCKYIYDFVFDYVAIEQQAFISGSHQLAAVAQAIWFLGHASLKTHDIHTFWWAIGSVPNPCQF